MCDGKKKEEKHEKWRTYRGKRQMRGAVMEKSLVFKTQSDLMHHRKSRMTPHSVFSPLYCESGWGPVIHSQVLKCIIWLPDAHYTNWITSLRYNSLIDTRIPGLPISSAALKFQNITHTINHKIFTWACSPLLYVTATPGWPFHTLLERCEGMPIWKRLLLLKHLILYFQRPWSSCKYLQFD